MCWSRTLDLPGDGDPNKGLVRVSGKFSRVYSDEDTSEGPKWDDGSTDGATRAS